MSIEERALTFACQGEQLVGILSLPAAPAPPARGVLIVVGGPQYRAGSHRQFTLLARSLAEQGIPAMRFDVRGMGDSEGATRGFDAIGDDVRAAVDTFCQAVPGLADVVLWGLCDAASAIAMYAPGDARVSGIVLLNPWVRTDEGAARATLKHYYRARLLDGAFWKKLLSGRFDAAGSLRSMAGLIRKALAPAATRAPDAETASSGGSLRDRMRSGLGSFRGGVLLITAGADLVAREFCDLAQADVEWKRLLGAPRVTRRQLDKADHTFSSRTWRDQVAGWTGEWVRSW
jgi:exosortase A-associated hydrolase 1